MSDHEHEPGTIFLTDDPAYTLVGFLDLIPSVQTVANVEFTEDGSLDIEFGDDDVWWEEAEQQLVEDPRLTKVPVAIVRADPDRDPSEPTYREVAVTLCSIVLDDGTDQPILWSEERGPHFAPKEPAP